MPRTRRLAAIVAADIVGYSRLMGRDEEGTLDRLAAVRLRILDPALAVHRGRIVKTAGDSFLIEFRSAVAAVRWSVEVQSALARHEAGHPVDLRLQFRIGVNLGDVIHDTGDVFGEGVNIAARLEQLAEPGTVCVSRAVFEEVRDRLRIEHVALGPQQVKNIARPVDAFALRVAADYVAAEQAAPDAVSPRRTRRYAAIAAALALVGIAVGWLGSGEAPGPPSEAGRVASAIAADQRSLLVLPLATAGSDGEQRAIADGLTMSLITDLSRRPNLKVIAHNAAFPQTQGHTIDAASAGRQSGARFVLQWSLHRAGDRALLNAHLFDAADGRHVWADRLDAPFSNVAVLENAVIPKVGKALNLRLGGDEQARRLAAETPSTEAFEAFLEGRELFERHSADTIAPAVATLQRAVVLDQNFSRAHAVLAAALMFAFEREWVDRLGLTEHDAAEAIDRSIARSLARPLAISHRVDAMRKTARGDFAAGIEAARLAVSGEPGDFESVDVLARAYVAAGQFGEASALLRGAARGEPRGNALATVGRIRFEEGRYEEAASHFEQVLRLDEQNWRAATLAASAYGHLARAADVQRSVSRLREVWSEGLHRPFSTLYLMHEIPVIQDPAYWQRVESGLRKAGVPEIPRDVLDPKTVRLDGRAIARLVFGRMHVLSAENTHETLLVEVDGVARIDDGRGTRIGKVEVDGDRLCARFVGIWRLERACWAVFDGRSKGDRTEMPNGYLLVGGKATLRLIPGDSLRGGLDANPKGGQTLGTPPTAAAK